MVRHSGRIGFAGKRRAARKEGGGDEEGRGANNQTRGATMKQGQVELDEKGRPKYFGAGLAYGDVVRLMYQEIGHDYFELQAWRAIALKIKRTRRLAKELQTA